MRTPLREFIRRLAIFIFPFAFVTAFILGYAIYLGELIPLSQLIALQQSDNRYLYYPGGDRDGFLSYKLYTSLYLNPELLFLGSSRLQFARSSIVTDARAYNASVVGLRLWENYDMLRALGEANALPELLIINIDFPDFNANRIAFRQGRAYLHPLDVMNESHRLANSARLSLQSFFSAPLDFLSYSQSRQLDESYIGLGFLTIQNATGYRQDGSFYRRYGQGGRGLAANLEWVSEGRESFEFGRELDANAVQVLNDLLDYASSKNLMLVGVLPPYHPEIYAAMNFEENYAYIPIAQRVIEESFANHDYLLFDYTDPASLPISGDDFFDGWHLTETGNLRMWMTMLATEPELFGRYAKLETLETMLSASSRFYVPE